MNYLATHRFLFLAIIIGCGYVPFVEAQISISISTDRQKYIRFEPIRLEVSLKNYSGHILNFASESKEGGFLALEVINKKGKAIPQFDSNFNPASNLILSPGVVKSLSIVISEYLNLQVEDDYELRVRVGHRRFRNDFLSHPVFFIVRSGAPVWKREVGLPHVSEDTIIATRSCSLNIFHQDEGDIYYYKNEDEEFVYSVIRLGPRVLGIKPQCEVDALSRVHTLIQTAPRLFNYRIIDIKGEIKHNSYYLINQSGPKLVHDSEVGSVSILGGIKGVEGVDFYLNKDINGQRSSQGGQDLGISNTIFE